MQYKEEFKEAHPETIGEKDSAFDMSNYIDWIDKKVERLENVIQEVLDDNHAFGHTTTATLKNIEKIKPS